jgi:hypothetical protein
MRIKYIMLLGISLALSIPLFGCGGGGGGGGSTPPPPPLIQALLFSFPTGSVPPAQFANALASVTDSSTGANITNASVTMNGVTLIYNGAPTHQEYEGNVTVMPGGSVTLRVTVGGNTYTASGTQFSSYPTISAPVSGAAWSASSANTVTWSGGAPLTNAVYLLGVLDATDLNGSTAYFQALAINVNSFPIPANSLTAGSRVVIVGITTPVSIPNAAANSALVFGGFNYVPITVMQWTARTFGAGVLESVIWSGTQFVAVGLVGFNGIIFTSPDGVTWTSQTASNASSLFGVTWSGTQFVAVGDGGTILTSPDGVTWTKQTSGTGNRLSGITWSGTQFVAVGDGGAILTSPDGVTWTARTSGISNPLYSITWSGTQFVAIGLGGAILTSPDGITWTQRTSGTVNALYGVTWSGTQFVTVGDGGTILTSPDGMTWTTRTSGISNPLYSIAWSGTNFVAVGNGGGILTSPEGVTWTTQTSGTVFNLYSVTWSGTQFVAVGDSTILTSP